ncbi:alpha/beta fold hydrolase [Tautonia plasticadhaerens]|nr:alpha/beta hydrolase [Tautonia plasticadhaerens]
MALMVLLSSGCGVGALRSHDPEAAARALAVDEAERQRFAALQFLTSGPGRPDLLLELAGLADRIGERSEQRGLPDALAWARDGASYSWFAARDAATVGRPPPWFEHARDLHNRSVLRCLRLAEADEPGRDPAWGDRLASVGIVVDPSATLGTGGTADQLLIAADHPPPRHLTPYRRPGWGVPLIAGRRGWAGRSPTDAFFPTRLQVPATALLVPTGDPDGGRWRDRPSSLVLVDPVDEAGVPIAPGLILPLAGDLTAPLQDQARRSWPDGLGWLGVFDPDRLAPAIGVYLTRPYDPGKIPVVLIHGLYSSPLTWVAMLNELQADPVLRSRYQFWVAFYPTGYPIPYSSSRIRERLRALRRAFDPEQDDSAFDRMVVVGHSMGGLVARSLILDPGDALSRAVFARPPDELDLAPMPQAALRAMFRTTPEPAIRRAIFLATPHRGSRLASRLLGRIGSLLVRRGKAIEGLFASIRDRYGLDALRPFFRGRSITGIDNLKWDNPLLRASASAQTASGVPYHSIIGVLPGTSFGRPGRGTDGVVGFTSAHLDGAASELVVPHHHMLTRLPEVIAEVRRILLLHLAEADAPAPIAGRLTPVPPLLR